MFNQLQIQYWAMKANIHAKLFGSRNKLLINKYKIPDFLFRHYQNKEEEGEDEGGGGGEAGE